MIKLIIGKRGSGKTKHLIEAVKDAANKSNGSVVCVEQGPVLTYDIPSSVRLIDTETYAISGYDTFFGFLAGICAGNYDLTNLFIDATLRIGGRDYNEFAKFIAKVNDLAKTSNTEITFTVSCDESDLPKEVFDYAQKA